MKIVYGRDQKIKGSLTGNFDKDYAFLEAVFERSGDIVKNPFCIAGREVVVAYAELSTSRLMVRDWYSPKLTVRRKADGVEIINIPLINYLLMLKSDLYASMDSQEFLDRESEWSMIFFLSPNLEWIKTYIKINDWTVRINDIRQ